MAIVILRQPHKLLTVTEQQGDTIWLIKNGEHSAKDDTQKAFVANVEAVYLDRSRLDLPNSYILANRDRWQEMDKGEQPARRPSSTVNDWINSKKKGSGDA
jgi:hypothetical protein